MINFLRLIVLTCSIIATSVFSAESKLLSLGHGLWEGINHSEFDYKLLHLTEDGHHRLLSARMVSGFTNGKVLKFGNDAIKCTTSECTITIVDKKRDETTKLILVPRIDDEFNVTESYLDENSATMLSNTYRMFKQNNKSTVREFISKYRKQLRQLASIDRSSEQGLWIGTMLHNGHYQMVTLELSDTQESHFTLFFSGSSHTNHASFLPAQIVRSGPEIRITTDHLTFANQLLIHKESDTGMRGYMYSVYKGHMLEHGLFKLYKLNVSQAFLDNMP